jgi:hypothetical protein
MPPLQDDAQKLAAEAAALAAEAKTQDTDALVDQWLADYFPPNLVTRNSAAWQMISTAAAELKRRLKGSSQ